MPKDDVEKTKEKFFEWLDEYFESKIPASKKKNNTEGDAVSRFFKGLFEEPE